MNRTHTLALFLVALLALGIGAKPRFIEELKIGGGYGDSDDGGADFEKNGNILTNGNVTATAFFGDGSGLGGVQAQHDNLDDLAALDPVKGTLLVGDGSAWNDLPIGANGQQLEADSAQTLGIKWSSAGGAGTTLPVADTTALVHDPSDATRLVRLDAGAVATGTTRVLSMPNQDINLSPGTGSFEAADADIAKIDTAQEWSRAQNFNATTLTDASSIPWDLSLNQVASVTLAGNRTLSNPTNLRDGGTYILIARQDATGSRTLAYGSAYKWPEGVPPTLTTAANSIDVLTFVSDGTNLFGVCINNFE